MSVARYHVKKATTVVFHEHNRDVAGLVPEGAMIEVSIDVVTGGGLVAGSWGGRAILMFLRDLRSNGILVAENAEQSHEEGRILQILRTDLQDANRNAATASEKFNQAVSAPTGLPHPDGTHHILRLSRELSSARNKLMESLRRLNTFLINGKVPDDLDQADDKDFPRHSSGR